MQVYKGTHSSQSATNQGGSQIFGVDTSSADMKPVVCAWQRMVVGGSTFFSYWMFMRWSAILKYDKYFWTYALLEIASVMEASFLLLKSYDKSLLYNGKTQGQLTEALSICTVGI